MTTNDETWLQILSESTDGGRSKESKYDNNNVKTSHDVENFALVVFSGGVVTLLLLVNWDAGIRTPISRSRVCGPTVGRRPTGNRENRSRSVSRLSRVFLQAGRGFAGFQAVGNRLDDEIAEDGGVHQSLHKCDSVFGQRGAQFVGKAPPVYG